MNTARGLTTRQKRIARSLRALLREVNHRHAWRGKTVAKATQHNRFLMLHRILVIELHVLGYQIERVEKLKPKHVAALIPYWEAQGLSAGTMQNRLAALRFLCRVLHKLDCLPSVPETLLSDARRWRRTGATTREKTLSAAGLDPQEVLARINRADPRVCVQLLLTWVLGLRRKEAAMLKPHLDDRGDRVYVRRGTKGGRPRDVALKLPPPEIIEAVRRGAPLPDRYSIMAVDETAREVLALAKLFAPRRGSSLIPGDWSLRAWLRHFTHVCAYHGRLTRRHGATPHSFRHEYLNGRYEAISGLVRPLRREHELTREQQRLDRFARQVVAEDAGHGIARKAGAYIGAVTERASPGLQKTIPRGFQRDFRRR